MYPPRKAELKSLQLRAFADHHFTAEISLLDLCRFFLPFLHTVLFDVAQGE